MAAGFAAALVVGSAVTSLRVDAAEKSAKADAGRSGKAAQKANAEASIDAGLAALGTGKSDQAIRHFNEALAAGNLTPALRARAYFQRGVAYRRAGQPDRAIADLTAALWTKGALSPSDRAAAIQERSAAFQEAGLSEQADPAAAAGASTVAQAKGKDAGRAPAVTKSAGSGWQTSTVGASGGDQAAPPLALSPDASGSQSVSIAPVANTLAGLFSGLFSGGSQPDATAEPAKPSPAELSAWAPVSDVRTGSNRTPAAAAAAPAPARVAAAPAQPPADPAKAAGRYKLRVATMFSRGEADAVVATLKSTYADALSGRSAVVDEVVHGNMGTYYQVSLAPFPSASEPAELCARLRAGGLDCLMEAR